MLDRVQGLNSNIGLSSFGGCKCKSESNIFDMVYINLLNAINEKNKNTINVENDMLTEGLNNISNKINFDTSNINTDKRIEEAIQMASKKYGVDSKLIKSIIKVESNFNPNVVSSAGAVGLMQIMPDNFKSLGISDPFNVEENINGGVKLIKQYLDRYNQNVEMALMAYNGGPTRMMNRGVNSISDIYKMPEETRNYVPKVMNYYRGY